MVALSLTKTPFEMKNETEGYRLTIRNYSIFIQMFADISNYLEANKDAAIDLMDLTNGVVSNTPCGFGKKVYMKTYTITNVSGQPEWEAIPSLEMNVPYCMTLDETPVRAWTQVAYNEDALLVRQWALEPVLRKELTGLLDEICEDSCLVFFICPTEGDERYFNIEYNPNGCRYLGFGRGLSDLVRLVPEENNDCFAPNITEFDGGWELIYQIPYHFIRRFFPDFNPAPGKTMRVNCSKCGDKTQNVHWLTWNPVPIIDGDFTFHSPSDYGLMIFD